MSGRRHRAPEQVVRKLRDAELLLGQGKDVTVVCKDLDVSEQTYYRQPAAHAA